MNEIEWGRRRWVTWGLLIAGLLGGVGYGQAPGGQAPAGPAPSAAAQTSSPDKIVLKVGDETVTQGEADRFIQGLGPQVQRKLAAQGRRTFGDELALMLVLSQEALKQHLDSSPGFQQMLALRHWQLLAQAEYEEIKRQAVVTPEEIANYFAAHQSDFEEVRVYEAVIHKKQEGAKEGNPGMTVEEAKTRAEEIRKAWNAGDDPKNVAEKFRVPNVVRVDAEAYPLRRGALRPDMEKAVFELKEGQVSEAFDVTQYLMIFKLASRKVKELSEVSPQIENTLRQQKVNSAITELKKNAKVWLDDVYFPAAPTQPGAQGATKPLVMPEGPAPPK